MKTKVIYIVLTCFVLSSTPLIELLKVPKLIEHFAAHRAECQELSFKDFLVYHYSTVPHTDDDEDEDNKLPFKVLTITPLEYTPIAISDYNALNYIEHIFEERSPKLRCAYQFSLGSDHLSSVWNPPKA